MYVTFQSVTTIESSRKKTLPIGLLILCDGVMCTLLEVNNKIQQRSHLRGHAMLCRNEFTECQQKFA